MHGSAHATPPNLFTRLSGILMIFCPVHRRKSGNPIGTGPAYGYHSRPTDREGRTQNMDAQQRQTLADYQRKGFVGRAGYGSHPALLIVDFIKGFTDELHANGHIFGIRAAGDGNARKSSQV